METIASKLVVRLKVVMDHCGSSFKKLFTGTIDNNKLPSSVHAVMSNDNLLIEILVRLPAISILLFKSVSKHWLSLITNPSFNLHMSRTPNVDSASGLFLCKHESSFVYYFVPFDIRLPPNTTPFSFGSMGSHVENLQSCPFKFGPMGRNVEILQSCNGLLLCCTRNNEYYIYNPSINRFKMLPQINHSNLNFRISGMKMAFDPLKSPHYKVVCAGYIYGDPALSFEKHIHTYSSKTCKWSVFADLFLYPSLSSGFDRGIYWNDSITWISNLDDIMHLKLDEDRPYLRSTQLPRTSVCKLDNWDHKLFESCGCLLLVFRDGNHQKLNVYEMKSVNSWWSLKYVVNLDEIEMIIPKAWKISNKGFLIHILSIVAGKREEDSFLVMELFGKVVQYKIVLKTLRKLFDSGSIHQEEPFRFPFIASFAGV